MSPFIPFTQLPRDTNSGTRTKNIVPDLDINEDFTPEGCEATSGPAVTYGAGQTSRDMYEKLDGTGYFVRSDTSKHNLQQLTHYRLLEVHARQLVLLEDGLLVEATASSPQP